jgi:Centromere DNA-binding protein complex CBF3 subunit, domain 2
MYKPKQKEFREWCERKQFRDQDAVTEHKLLLFITSEVAGRPLRAKSYKVDKSVPLDRTRLSWTSVRGYVSAITDLYREQKALGINCHPSPREDTVRQYLKTLQRRDTKRQKEQFADKGRDTLLDGYSEQDFEQICRQLWAHSDKSPECHFRTLVDLLLGHYLLARGGDRRAAEISDLFTFEFTGEGPTRCMPLILTTRQGKQNQHGRLETAGALRNRNPQVCPLSGLAFYLLCRWDLTDEPFPDFSERSAWYNIRLLKGSAAGTSPTAALAYNSQLDWVSKAFRYAGVVSRKKTHTGRPSGAKTAELKGVSEDQIRRAGRWNHEQMVGCYLSSLPRKFMRIMAGHPPQMGCFEIRRASVTPRGKLLSLIWPQLDQWKDRFGPREGQSNDLAAMGLTDLLFYLREVILQDSVILRERFPNCPIWNHPVWRSGTLLALVVKVSGPRSWPCSHKRFRSLLTTCGQVMRVARQGATSSRPPWMKLRSSSGSSYNITRRGQSYYGGWPSLWPAYHSSCCGQDSQERWEGQPLTAATPQRAPALRPALRPALQIAPPTAPWRQRPLRGRRSCWSLHATGCADL